MTIGKRIAFGFVGVVLVTGTLGGFLWERFSRVSTVMTTLDVDSIPGLEASGRLAEGIRAENEDLLLHILANTKELTAKAEEAFRSEEEAVTTAIKEYDASITQQDDRAQFDAFKAEYTRAATAREHVLALSRELKQEEAMASFYRDLDPILDSMQEKLDRIVDWNAEHGDSAVAAGTDAVASGRVALLIGVAAAALIASGLGFYITASTRKALAALGVVLANNSEQVASASSQVSASSQSLAQGASEQAASLEETSSAINELASMVKQNAETSQQANSFSADAKQAADAGTEAMNRMNTAIVDIERASQETAKIIKTIDEIAFQTNLLALNAAVEAARAGEAGKGFAVVAEEVRNLAMRSADAAKNTSSLIEESVSKAKNGVSIAQTVASNLQQINDATLKVTSLIAEIAAASKEQATGIDQITGAVGQMDKVTQTNAANAEETAAASEELSAQAEQLQGCVRDLQALVGLTSTVAQPRATQRVASSHFDGHKQTAKPAAPAKKPARTAKADAHDPHAVTVRKPTAKQSARDLIPLESVQAGSNDFSDFTESKAA